MKKFLAARLPILLILFMYNSRQKTKQENDVLRTYLKAAQDDITIFLEEKKALLDTIRSLQVSEVTSSKIVLYA